MATPGRRAGFPELGFSPHPCCTSAPWWPPWAWCFLGTSHVPSGPVLKKNKEILLKIFPFKNCEM